MAMLMDIEEVMEETKLGRSKVLELSYGGEMPSLKVGRRRLWPTEQVKAWISDRVEEAQHGNESD